MKKEIVLKKIKEYEEVFGKQLPKETTNDFNFAENYARGIDKCISEHKTMEEMGWDILDFYNQIPPHKLSYND